MINLNKKIVWAAVTLTMFYLCACENGSVLVDHEIKKNGIIKSDDDFSSSAEQTTPQNALSEEELKSILEAKLSTWSSEQIFIGEKKTGYEMKNKMDVYNLAKAVTDDSFAFNEIRANGKAVYKNESQETIKYDEGLGYWEFIGKEQSKYDNVQTPMTDQAAKEKTELVLNSLGIDLGEVGKIYVTGIGVSTEEDALVGKATAVARHVRIYRQINSVPVLDSQVLATYGLDGEPINIEVRWPNFKVNSDCVVKTRGEVIDQLVDSAYSSLSSLKYDSIQSKIAYAFSRQENLHTPVLHIRYSNEYGESNELMAALCN